MTSLHASYISLLSSALFQATHILAAPSQLHFPPSQLPSSRSFSTPSFTMSEMTITNVTPVPIAVAWGMAKKGNEIMPKVMPAFFAAIEVLEGDGGAGTVRVVTLGEGAGPEGAGKKVKERVDVMDDATHTISYTVVEGGDPRYTNVQFTLKFTPAGDTTSVEWTVRYTPVNDSVPPPQHMKAMYESSMEAMSAYAKQHAAEFA